MKIAIISDTHDNMANLQKFLAVFGKECAPLSGAQSGAQSCGIIHCGDVTTPETLDWLADNFSGPIKVAEGNMEIRREEFAEVVAKHKNLEVFAEIGVWELEIRGVLTKIAFIHRPNRNEELAHPPAGGKAYSFVFYGHTHKPWISQIGATLVANPGTLGGVFTAPTYAILDTETGQLALHRL